jgi:hypothetical protein
MKKLTLALAVFTLSVAPYPITTTDVGSAQEPNCERPACQSGDRYSASRHRCESSPSSVGGYRSPYHPTCPAGFNLDEARGLCVQPGECCLKRACRSGYQFRDGRCHSRRAAPGDRPPYVPECGAGWDLDAAIGMCRKRDCGASDAQVERLGPTPCVDRGGTVTIYGSGFGLAQGTRLVELGGHGIGVILRVTSWSDTQITAIVPDDRRIEFSQWYYIGLQDHDRHWISNISRTITICRQFG